MSVLHLFQYWWLKCRSVEWSIDNDESQQILIEPRNLSDYKRLFFGISGGPKVGPRDSRLSSARSLQFNKEHCFIGVRAWLHDPGWVGFAEISARLLNATKSTLRLHWTRPARLAEIGIAMPGSRLTGLTLFYVSNRVYRASPANLNDKKCNLRFAVILKTTTSNQ